MDNYKKALSARSFVFRYLQIPIPATPVFSHPYKTPGVYGLLSPTRPPIASPLTASYTSATAVAVPLFSYSYELLSPQALYFDNHPHCPGVWGPPGQRGRGRSGGRAVRARGRMRKRGLRGGGTLRRKSPQQGQRPSTQNARVASARSHWPRASHCAFMHCTVKPGRYCIWFPLQRPHRLGSGGP
jgi:hypothetical protein